ncbi:cyclic nucleotide-binding domain-containing protein [Thermodesulfobacteriota bacterium]
MNYLSKTGEAKNSMDAIHDILGKRNRELYNSIKKIFDAQFASEPISWELIRTKLVEAGVQDDEAMMLLAYEKSKIKYGYEISARTLAHLFKFAKQKAEHAPLLKQFESLFFIIKTCWLYEHSPYFLFLDEGSDELDEYILKFSRHYYTEFQEHDMPIHSWKKAEDPKRVTAVTFWENKIIDPLAMLNRARKEKYEGLELSIDFHPFNYTRLLPEELSQEKRFKIKKAIDKSGLKVDIHSPIVGPYSPEPDPKKGKQLFFNPLKCFNLQVEVIELAKEIGAESVVIHLINNSDLEKIVDLVMKAAGSKVRVTLENYCHTNIKQNTEFFISTLDEISRMLPEEVKVNNFGITLDVGHFNIEGQDPLVAAEKIGDYCRKNNLFIRMHATDNYGELLFSPPAYSADVHNNVSGRGINNSSIIKLLRSMGHRINVVTEQILPLTPEDISTIHDAQTFLLNNSFDGYVNEGRELLSSANNEYLFTQDIINEKAYLFLAGIEGLPALREHIIFRNIQDKKHLSVDEVKKVSQDFMRIPHKLKKDMLEFVDDLLLPIQRESGAVHKNELDVICQNISGALFGTINNQHLNQIFSSSKVFNKGDLICEQGTIGKEMFYIKEGKVEVLINGNSMAELGPGEIFGEISLFYNVKRTANVRAFEDRTKVGILTRKGFESLLKKSQPHSHDLIYRLYSILPERLRNLNEKYKTATNALHYILNKSQMDLDETRRMNGNYKLSMDPFLSLSREEAMSVFRDTKSYDKDQYIFKEGDKADGAYYIIEGKVKIVSSSTYHGQVILDELGEDEIFGEMSLIDNKPRSATIITATQCKIAFVDKQEFNEFIENRYELSFKLMACICLSLFLRILRLDRLFSDVKKTLQ